MHGAQDGGYPGLELPRVNLWEVKHSVLTPTTSLWLWTAYRHPLTQAALIRPQIYRRREDSLFLASEFLLVKIATCFGG